MGAFFTGNRHFRDLKKNVCISSVIKQNLNKMAEGENKLEECFPSTKGLLVIDSKKVQEVIHLLGVNLWYAFRSRVQRIDNYLPVGTRGIQVTRKAAPLLSVIQDYLNQLKQDKGTPQLQLNKLEITSLSRQFGVPEDILTLMVQGHVYWDPTWLPASKRTK